MAILTDPATYQATRFTLDYGALPIFATSMYCRSVYSLLLSLSVINFFEECFRQYHHNYSVHKNTETRAYYPGVPCTIQAATHFFIDTPLLELFANAKVFGWQVKYYFHLIYH